MTRRLSHSLLLLVSCIIVLSQAWTSGSFPRWNLPHYDSTLKLEGHLEDTSTGDATCTERHWSSTRRVFFGTTLSLTIGMVGSAGSAVAATDSSEEIKKTIYKSGKTPIVPGAKPKDKSDLKGTRKDPDFLRSVADCRNSCQNTPGSDGYARSKEDCLSECQDICCKTYEQCTFDIVPRI